MLNHSIRIAVFIISTCLTVLSCLADELPELGNPSRLTLSSLEEEQMGTKMMQELERHGLILADPIATDYLKKLGNKLVAASNKANKEKIDFFIIADNHINAFAGPGGHIGVNSGLILATESEGELAGVLSHEIAHETQKHLASKLAELSNSKFQSLAGALAALAIGILNPQAAPHAIAVAMAGSQQNFLNFSRAHEQEADRVGISTMIRAGYNPKDMMKFLKMMLQQERYHGEVPAWVMTHPITEDRLADIAHRSQTYTYEKSKSSLDFYLMKERLRAFTSSDTHELLTYYQETLRKGTLDNQQSTEYGYSIALLFNQQYPEAINVLEKLNKEDPHQIPYQLSLAHAYTENHQESLGTDLLKTLHQQHPENYSIMLSYAKNLLEVGKPKLALRTLQTYLLNHPESDKPFETLSRAQVANGFTAEAYQTRAQFFTSKGEHKQALDQLKIALNLPNLNPEAKRQILAKMDAIKDQKEKA